MKIFRLKMNVQKVDNLQIDGPSIIVANHQSSLDLLGRSEISVSNKSSNINRYHHKTNQGKLTYRHDGSDAAPAGTTYKCLT